jgi:AcrR family transcriptional regulator
MSPRRYRLERRAETAEQTRRRLVEATQRLHAEQGIYATTMTQIAERAGVSVGTAYHHFPTYADACSACSQRTAEMIPFPSAETFAGLQTVEERVHRLAQEVFGFYQRLPQYERVRSERFGMPPIAAYADWEEDNRLALTREALRPLKSAGRLARTCSALLDVAVYGALTRAGMTPAQAADDVATFILARLAHVPTKWIPVRRQEHAPLKESLERVSVPKQRDTL